MKLVVWIDVYDCPYYNDWKRGIARQLDKDFEIYYSLEHACRDADAVLCLDIDDIPEPALIHVAKLNAREYDVTAIAMKIINEDNQQTGYFGKMINVNDYNVWGFGNTVWRSGILEPLLPIRDVYPADWDTVTRAYKNGAHLHFEPMSLIRYRQYGQESNLVKLGDVYVWGKEVL